MKQLFCCPVLARSKTDGHQRFSKTGAFPEAAKILQKPCLNDKARLLNKFSKQVL
jgi:hypothetical protein